MPLARKLLNVACRGYGLSLGRFSRHGVILCYHSVSDGRGNRGWLARHRSVDAGLFERQMTWLKQNFPVVDLDRILRDDSGATGPRVAVTFDDGYVNNVEVVMPILERLDIPMTWFVATGFVDKPAKVPWWDLIDLALERGEGSIALTSAEVAGEYDLSRREDHNWFNRQLRNILKSVDEQRRDAIVGELGSQVSMLATIPENAFARPHEVAAVDPRLVELGGHSVTHPNLTRCSDAGRRHEITAGKARLEEVSGRNLAWFAYPFGGVGSFDEPTEAAVREAGFRGAVTLVPGFVGAGINPYRVPRIPISPTTDLDDFKARVQGAPIYSYADRVRRWFRLRRDSRDGRDSYRPPR